MKEFKKNLKSDLLFWAVFFLFLLVPLRVVAASGVITDYIRLAPTTLPAVCAIGDIRTDTSTSTPQFCSAANTWSNITTGISASLTSGNILVGNASNVPTSVAMSGDATIVAGGSLTIANLAITNAKVAATAAIAYYKLAALTAAHILVGNGSSVATDVAMSGDVSISNAGATTVGTVGTSTAANVHAAELLANAATSANTASTIMKRDGSNLANVTSLRYNGSTSGTLTQTVPATVTSYSIIWPSAQASGVRALQNDGSGNLSWTSIVTSPAGADTNVQYNDSSSFGGDSNFTWNKTTHVLTAGGSGATMLSPLHLGSNSSGGTVTLESTSNATKGQVIIGDQLAEKTRIGPTGSTTTYVDPVHVLVPNSNSYLNGFVVQSSDADFDGRSGNVTSQGILLLPHDNGGLPQIGVYGDNDQGLIRMTNSASGAQRGYISLGIPWGVQNSNAGLIAWKVSGTSGQSVDLAQYTTDDFATVLASIGSAGQYRSFAGTSVLPGQSFQGATGDGMYDVSSGTLGWSLSGTQAMQLGTTLDVKTRKIVNVVDPTSAQDAATKSYVDSQLLQLNPADSVQAASIATVVGTYTNLVSGVCIADTFTVTATGAFVLDGYTVASGDRILLKNQTNSFQDGVWTVTNTGSVGVSPIFTRALDFDSSADINAGQIIPIINGTVNAGASYFQTATNTTCNTSTQTWTQFQKASSAYALSALTSAHILVGNGSSVATDVALSGDASLSNAGALTLSTVSVAKGGTGQTTYTDGQLLIGNSSGNTLSKAALTQGANITITNGNGTITIAASSTATPAFTAAAKTANYTLIAGDDIEADGSSGAFTLTLPDAATNAGKPILVSRKDSTTANLITIAVAGSDTFPDASTSMILIDQGSSVTLVSRGAIWYLY